MLDELQQFIAWAAFNPGSRFFWGYLLIYLVLGLVLLHFSRDSARAEADTSLINRLFPKSVYTHPSFILDVKLFAVFYLVGRLGGFTVVIVASTYLANELVVFSQTLFALQPTQEREITLFDRTIFTLVVIIAFDLASFLSHYAMHKVKFLWAFHQVHHSAEHLTPLTATRFHPVDNMIVIGLQTLMTTLAVSLFTLIHGTSVQLITVLNVSAVIVGFNLLSNFRHSHIWLSFGPKISKALVSPCMHQVHHSCETRHLDKNFGLIFSLWDGIAKSRYIPAGKESFELGIRSGNLVSRDAFWKHLVQPLQDSWKTLLRK